MSRAERQSRRPGGLSRAEWERRHGPPRRVKTSTIVRVLLGVVLIGCTSQVPVTLNGDEHRDLLLYTLPHHTSLLLVALSLLWVAVLAVLIGVGIALVAGAALGEFDD